MRLLGGVALVGGGDGRVGGRAVVADDAVSLLFRRNHIPVFLSAVQDELARRQGDDAGAHAHQFDGFAHRTSKGELVFYHAHFLFAARTGARAVAFVVALRRGIVDVVGARHLEPHFFQRFADFFA